MRLQDNGILGVFVNNDLPLGSVCKLDARLVVPFVVAVSFFFVDVATADAAEVRVSQLLPGGSVNI